MFHQPDPDTGYYDPDERFYEEDARREAEEEARYLEELEASQGCDSDRRPIMPPDYMDPETGCTVAEMKEADRMPSRTHVMFPPELSVGQTITARWGRGRRKGVA